MQALKKDKFWKVWLKILLTSVHSLIWEVLTDCCTSLIFHGVSINHPSEVLALNQKINVVVLDFDENKKRISLGLKQLQPHPWEVLDEGCERRFSVVKGKIVNIEDYGAFLEINPGVEGLDPRF